MALANQIEHKTLEFLDKRRKDFICPENLQNLPTPKATCTRCLYRYLRVQVRYHTSTSYWPVPAA
jgi:hypothetical protein